MEDRLLSRRSRLETRRSRLESRKTGSNPEQHAPILKSRLEKVSVLGTRLGALRYGGSEANKRKSFRGRALVEMLERNDVLRSVSGVPVKE